MDSTPVGEGSGIFSVSPLSNLRRGGGRKVITSRIDVSLVGDSLDCFPFNDTRGGEGSVLGCCALSLSKETIEPCDEAGIEDIIVKGSESELEVRVMFGPSTDGEGSG